MSPDDGSKTRNICAHFLICRAFHGPRPSRMHVVAHFDGNKLNNSKSNLRWATYKENALDMKRHGRQVRGEASPRSKVNAEDVVAIRTLWHRELSQRDIAQIFGISQREVARIIHRKVWAHVEVVDKPLALAPANRG